MKYFLSKFTTMKWLILFFLMIVITNNSWAQNSDCKVLHKAIEGTYEGGCDKSKANGQGKAAGTDSYEGTFKNGLPEGYGKYIWHDGHYYVGLFKKGNKEGKGDMYYEAADGSDSTISGYWKKDKYVGEYEKSFELIASSTNVLKVDCNFSDAPGENIVINVHQLTNATGFNGVSMISYVTSISPIQGTFLTHNMQMLSNSSITTVRQVVFPFKAIFYLSNGEQAQILFNNKGCYDVKIDMR